MKNNLDQHIDKKLKTSFDGIQKKAPDGLWEQISGKMDVEDTENISLDEKIQTAHLDAPIQKAPASIWDKIDNALEETAPIDTQLDEKIKDGFLSDSKMAPSFLWGAISDELSTPPLSVDETLDDKLKEGFLSQETKKTPNKVWYAVSRQLNIDKTWDRISNILDKEPVVSDWRSRIFRFFAAAALLLLLLKTCTHEPHFIENNDLVQTVENHRENVNTKENSTLVPKNNPNKGTEKPEHSSKNNTTTKSIEGANSDEIQSSKNNNEKIIGPVPTLGDKDSSQERKKETTKGSTSTNTSEIEDNSEEESAIIAILIPEEPKSTSILNSKTDLENTAKGAKTKSLENNSTLDETQKEFNFVSIDALNPNSLAVVNNVEPIQLLDEIALEKRKKTTKNLIAGKLEAGAFAVVNSTMLLNNETREGFDQNSLTTNYFGLAANYGLWASYRILPKGALVAEFSINADNRQAYGTYDQGVFYIKEWVMKYNRFSLAYKHDLWQTNSDKLINTKVVAQAGVYVGMMREAKLFYDGVLFFDKQAEYHQFDFGFKVALGQEILIDKFVLGYGIRSDIGASNIFKGNNQLNPGEDKTNIIHLGGYVLFGYRF